MKNIRGDFMDFKETTIERQYIHKGRVINLRIDRVKLPDGKTSTREIVEHNGGVGIVALNEKRELILVRQFRKPFEEVLIEIPAGKIEKGEEPYNCALREFEEETGNRSLELELISEIYPSPGFSDEKLYIYFCKSMEKGNVKLDEDENVDVIYVPYDEALNMINSGRIKDAKSIIGILMAKKFI